MPSLQFMYQGEKGTIRKARVILNRTLLVLLLGVAFITVITRVNAAEPTLENILHSLGFVERTVVVTETFPPGIYKVTLYAEYAIFRGQNQLGWYELGASGFNLIFDGLEGVPLGQPMGMVNPTLTRYFLSSSNFGLSFLSPDGTFYTETSRNPDVRIHTKIYQSNANPNLYLIGFENMGAQPFADFDYNDMVFSLEKEPYRSPIADIGKETVSNWMTSGRFGWNSGYAISFMNQTLDVVINIKLLGDDPGNALKQQWHYGIEGIWSNSYDIVDGPYTYKIEISSNWVDSNQHHAVTVHFGTGRTNMLNWYTDRPSGWGNEYQDEIAAHEAGHMLGLYDEYDGGAVDPNTNFITTNSIMADLGPPREWHFEYMQKWLETKSGRNLSLAPSPLPSYPLNAPIPSFNDPMMSMETLNVHLQPTLATINLGQSLTFIATAQGGKAPYFYQWCLGGNSVPGASLDGWVFTPSTYGTYYVYLQVTDFNNSTTQSETARVSVVSVPVGGYSVSFNKYSTTGPLTLYLALSAMLAVFLVAVRREHRSTFSHQKEARPHEVVHLFI